MDINRPVRLQALNLNEGKLEGPLSVIFCGRREGYEASAHLLQGHKQLSVSWAASGDELIKQLAQGGCDCILMEGLVGTETAYTIKDRISQQGAPVPALIMLAKPGGEKSAAMAFQQGFSDYLIADDLSPETLYVQILRAVNAKRVERDYQAKIASLSQQLTIDPATGLNNHAFLDTRLASLLDNARQFQTRVAVLLIDVNHFRELKGKYGYEMGQRFMRGVADRLKGAARRADVFGRYGESSFLYLVDWDVSGESIEAVGRRLAEGLNFDCNLGEFRMRASASIGAAIFPEEGADAAALLKAAGAAMAQAKTLGGGYYPASALSAAPPEASGVSPTEAAPAAQPPDAPAVAAPQQAAAEARPGAVLGDDNRRRSRRSRALKRGCISIQNGMSTIYCTVRDQSDGGVRVAFNSIVNLPKYVDLELTEHGQKFHAEVRWTNGLFAGLKFLGAAEDSRAGHLADANRKR